MVGVVLCGEGIDNSIDRVMFPKRGIMVGKEDNIIVHILQPLLVFVAFGRHRLVLLTYTDPRKKGSHYTRSSRYCPPLQFYSSSAEQSTAATPTPHTSSLIEAQRPGPPAASLRRYHPRRPTLIWYEYTEINESERRSEPSSNGQDVQKWSSRCSGRSNQCTSQLTAQ